MEKRRVVCLLMTVSLMVSTTVAFADELSDKKQELQGINQDIESAKDKIAKVKDEQTATMNQIAEIELDLRANEELLVEIEESLAELQESIEITEEELQEAIDKADRHKELMDERICTMYMSSGTTHLEVLFGAKSITDFVDRVAMVKEIMSLDKEVFDEMLEITAEIEETKASLEEQKVIEEDTQKGLEAQKELIEEKRAEQETLFAELEEQRKEMEEDLDELERVSDGLKSEINALIERQEEERRRRIAAQVAAANTTSRGSSRTNSDSGSVPSGGSNGVVAFARSLIGKPYNWGSTGPNSFDCSGFACYVYKNSGVDFQAAGYRSSSSLAGMSIGTKISSKSDLQPGDLVFFGSGGKVSHVGIYAGGGSFVHAQNKQSGVIETSLDSGSYSRRFICGRRIN